jgi:hypothetical protein
MRWSRRLTASRTVFNSRANVASAARIKGTYDPILRGAQLQDVLGVLAGVPRRDALLLVLENERQFLFKMRTVLPDKPKRELVETLLMEINLASLKEAYREGFAN